MLPLPGPQLEHAQLQAAADLRRHTLAKHSRDSLANPAWGVWIQLASPLYEDRSSEPPLMEPANEIHFSDAKPQRRQHLPSDAARHRAGTRRLDFDPHQHQRP